MTVFFIPAWFPTPQRPLWCRWILPHHKLTRSIADTCVVLQVDLESKCNEPDFCQQGDHFYWASGEATRLYGRTFLYYGFVLKRYCARLDRMYAEAVRQYGKPDLLHAHVSMPAGYGAAMLGKKYGVPVVVTEHYSGFFSDNRFPWRLPHYYKKMINQIDGFYTVSPGFSENVQRHTNLRVDGITPNPVDTSFFSMEKLPSHEGIRFISVGDWGERKGTDILLEAINILGNEFDWSLTVVGKQNRQMKLPLDNPLIRERVCFMDRQAQPVLRELFNNSDIFIVSSRVETANVAMQEAMSCGCFVVTNRIGAPETLLSQEVCETFSGTPDSLASALKRAVTRLSGISREKLSDFIASHYSTEVLSGNLKEIYRSALNRRNR